MRDLVDASKITDGVVKAYNQLIDTTKKFDDEITDMITAGIDAEIHSNRGYKISGEITDMIKTDSKILVENINHLYDEVSQLDGVTPEELDRVGAMATGASYVATGLVGAFFSGSFLLGL
ncbi:hypothetical protein ADUPG1_003481, partial [Aduncisulcus paluster]